MRQKSSDLAIDALRVTAILAVLIIHTTTRLLESVHLNIQIAFLPFAINQISRFSVPLFFLISGYVLELNLPFKPLKRLLRIGIPYILWSVIYYYFVYTQHSLDFLSSLIGGNASYQLYFIPTLLLFYLLFPVLRKIPSIFIWPLGIIELVILYFDYYIHSLPVIFPIAVALFNYFPFLLGIFFARQPKIFYSKFVIPVMSLLGGLVVYEGYTRYLSSYNYIAFYSQWRPSVLLYSIAIFVILYKLFTKLNWRIFHTLSSLSFFVFFIHVLVLEIVWKYVHQGLFFSILTIVISFSLAYLTHKIPYLSKLTG